jgi:hypothetical protein
MVQLRNKWYTILWFFAGGLLVNTSARAQYSAEQWKADIEILRTELPARHPDLFKNWSREAYNQALDEVATHAGVDNNLQMGLRLQAVLARFRDAQTYADLKPFLLRTNPIPFGLGKYSDGVYLSGTVRKFGHLGAKKVITVNGMPMEEVTRRLGMFVSAENDLTVYKEAYNWLRFPESFKMVGISQSDSLLLLLENEQGKQGLGYVYPIDLKNPADMQPMRSQAANTTLRWQPAESFYSVHWLAADSVLHVLYHRCLSHEMAEAAGDAATAEMFPYWQPVADSILAQLRRHPGARLLFDLRFNPGGGASDGIALADSLAKIPAVNQKNKLFVATTLYTGQAAIEIAGAFRTRTRATLVGEPTAGRPNHFGGSGSFILPNTRMPIMHATSVVNSVFGNPDTLQPDQLIELNYTTYRAGGDPVYEWVKKQR